MSAAELRRGEQSALHCAGTRTLQVRNPSPPKTTCREDSSPHARNSAQAPPSQGLAPFSAAPSPR